MKKCLICNCSIFYHLAPNVEAISCWGNKSLSQILPSSYGESYNLTIEHDFRAMFFQLMCRRTMAHTEQVRGRWRECFPTHREYGGLSSSQLPPALSSSHCVQKCHCLLCHVVENVRNHYLGDRSVLVAFREGGKIAVNWKVKGSWGSKGLMAIY